MQRSHATEKPQAKAQLYTKGVEILEVMCKVFAQIIRGVPTKLSQFRYLIYILAKSEKCIKLSELHEAQLRTFSIEAELLGDNLMAEKFS